MSIPILNGKIDWVTLFDNSPYLSTMRDIDIESLERFVIAAETPIYAGDPNDTFDPANITVTADEEAAANAAALIIIVMGGIIKGGDIKNLLRSTLDARKPRIRMFDPENVTPGSPGWNIIESREREEIDYEKMLEDFMEQYHLSRSVAERSIRTLRLRVKHHLDASNSLSKPSLQITGQKTDGDN